MWWFTITLFIYSLQSLSCHDSRLNFFDTDLLRYAAEDRRGNVLVSPASVKSTLAMILEGAEGVTAAEIRSALRLSPRKEDFREQLNLYLSALMTYTTGVLLQNTNAVFVSNKLKLKRQYETMLANVYFNKIWKIDFMDPLDASHFINNWVSESTKGLIPSIIDPALIPPTTDIIIMNALYFKSAWQHAFDPRETHAACFYNRGACQKAAMMELHRELNYAYVDNLMAHAVELPYQGGRYSMILLVPLEKEGCAQLIRDLPYMSLLEISKIMEPYDVQLTMPKFEVHYNEDLVGPLKQMKINTLFSPQANLSGIFEGTPFLNSIYHNVHLSVNEEGTVAAAATSAVVIPLMESGVYLRVDRPFVFFIRDNQLGLVLFEGKIEEPSFLEETGMPAGNPVPATKTGNNNLSRIRFVK